VEPSNDQITPDQGGSPIRVHIRKGKTNPRRIAYLILLMFAVPPGGWILMVGVVLVSLAVLLHGWAAGYLARAGYAERETVLTVRGPYRHNRNPYYAAHMTMDLGFFFLGGWALFYLLYLPVILSVYRRWVLKEERFLEKEFGEDYRTFKREVPRWRFRITPAPARGREQTFQWTTFMLNRELQRAVPHVVLLGVFVAYFFFGNPLEVIDPLVRWTVIAAVAVWLALHDIYPLDVSMKSRGWTLAASGIAGLTAVFLVRAPVWDAWSGGLAWASIAAGIGLGILGSVAAIPALTRAVSKRGDDLFSRPMSQWYVLGLGLGLISCRLGGVWVGVMLPLFFWALGLAGWVPLVRVWKNTAVGVGLLLLFAVAGGVSLVWN
jgi:hypothetical protein